MFQVGFMKIIGSESSCNLTPYTSIRKRMIFDKGRIKKLIHLVLM